MPNLRKDLRNVWSTVSWDNLLAAKMPKKMVNSALSSGAMKKELKMLSARVLAKPASA